MRSKVEEDSEKWNRESENNRSYTKEGKENDKREKIKLKKGIRKQKV